MTVEEHFAYLAKGCVDIVRADDLKKKIERSVQTGQPLVVKVGFDPTAPDLHLGHTVVIRKMKHFQDLGHTVIFLIGDFTGMIGDPTGRSKARPPLRREEIDRNADTYTAQVFKLLDAGKTVVDFNSKWLSALGAEGWIRLAARHSVAQMLERRDFKERYEKRQPIAIHEFLYPLAQAYDSVYLKADVELGGTDQLFNLNVGRDIMPGYNLEPQIVMTTPLLVGLDGKEKMSKSAGNYVGIMELPNEMFGKLMSISDDLMWEYYELLTDLSVAEIDRLKARVSTGDLHPKQAKVDLAKRIVADFHSRGAADAAEAAFDRRFARKETPTDLPQMSPDEPVHAKRLPRVLVEAGLASSTSEIGRKIREGALRVDGEKKDESTLAGQPIGKDALVTVQIGRRAVRVDQYAWIRPVYRDLRENNPEWPHLTPDQKGAILLEAVIERFSGYPPTHLEEMRSWGRHWALIATRLDSERSGEDPNA